MYSMIQNVYTHIECMKYRWSEFRADEGEVKSVCPVFHIDSQ